MVAEGESAPLEKSDLIVRDEEFILRALSNDDVAVSQGVKWKAVAPRISEESASVMRLSLMGEDAAKAKGLELKGAKFHGLARARARTIRSVAKDVVDSRWFFHGHADLEHPFARPPRNSPPTPGEPVEPTEEYLEAVKYYRVVAGLFCIFVDSAESSKWVGADLHEHCQTEPSGGLSCAHARSESEESSDRGVVVNG